MWLAHHEREVWQKTRSQRVTTSKLCSFQECVLHGEADGESFEDYKEGVMWLVFHSQEFPELVVSSRKERTPVINIEGLHNAKIMHLNLESVE